MDTLENRVAVVTGAARGIGAALAARLLAGGMDVVLADVDGPALEAHTEALRAGAPAGRRLLAVTVDVSRAEEVDALAARAIEAFGRVHLLCNNAGVSCRPAPVWEQPLEDVRRILDVNLFGVLHGVRAFVPHMLAHGEDAHIVNVASIAGLATSSYISPYILSKHAVVALSESLHHDLRQRGARIKVSVLCPGFVRTDIIRRGLAASTRPAGPPDVDLAVVETLYLGLIDRGASPASVADAAAEAVRAGRFYVLPQPELAAQVRRRMEEIVEGRDPTFHL